MKFELAGKCYPSKQIMIFCAARCSIGIFRDLSRLRAEGGGRVTLRVYCRLWSCELAQSSLQALLSDRRIHQKNTETGKTQGRA